MRDLFAFAKNVKFLKTSQISQWGRSDAFIQSQKLMYNVPKGAQRCHDGAVAVTDGHWAPASRCTKE